MHEKHRHASVRILDCDSQQWMLIAFRAYSDLKENTFTKFLDELLSEMYFLLEREVAGSKMIVPNWAHFHEYDFQIRKEALKLDNPSRRRCGQLTIILSTELSIGSLF